MKGFIFVVIIVFAAWFLFFRGPKPPQNVPVTDLSSALSQAETEEKVLFLLVGRENCGNCRKLRQYINDEEIQLPAEKFVFADIDCDNKQMYKDFNSRFYVEGNALPLVVVADPYGRQLATRSGYGTPEDFTLLIQNATEILDRYSY